MGVAEGKKHIESSPETREKFDKLQKTLEDHMDAENTDLQELKRVIYGDPKKGDVGMAQMVKEMHTKVVQANGVISFFKLILLIGGASGVLYTLFRKF